jgi:hypothetical protein
VNTATTLFAGRDTRNYYRADRGDVTVAQAFEGVRTILAPSVGLRVERSWSAFRDSAAASVPWSLIGRRDAVDGMRRGNPAVTGGTITSALAAVDVRRLVGR